MMGASRHLVRKKFPRSYAVFTVVNGVPMWVVDSGGRHSGTIGYGNSRKEAWDSALDDYVRVALVTDCGICGGTGAVDSGGFTPWGAGIDVKCGYCNGTGKEPK